MQNARYKEGSLVRWISCGKIGAVIGVNRGIRSYSYKVLIDGRTQVIPEEFLGDASEIDSEEKAIESYTNQDHGGLQDLKNFLIWYRLTRSVEGELYSYLCSKTVFNPHQYKPLLRFISPNSEDRLFIADEVGVGKTIETGIVIREMLARGRLSSKTPILIVCPNSILTKWQREMKEKFMLEFSILDGNSLRFMLETTIADGVVPKSCAYSIVSLPLLRRGEHRDLLERLNDRQMKPVFGLVVIDECHHMRNPETDSNALGNKLTEMTEMMLMLSATPLNLSNDDLFNQMHILNRETFPDKHTFAGLHRPVRLLNRIRFILGRSEESALEEYIEAFHELEQDPLGKIIIAEPAFQEIHKALLNCAKLDPSTQARFDRALVEINPLYHSFTRTRKREALEHQVKREVWEIPIELGEAEMVFQKDALEMIKNMIEQSGQDSAAIGFIMNTYRRMLSSSIPASSAYFNRARSDSLWNDALEGESEDDPDDNADLEVVCINDDGLIALASLAVRAQYFSSYDSKYDQFLHILKQITQNRDFSQVIIFSFFIETLEYLRRRLASDGFKVGMIHGGIPVVGGADGYGRQEIIDQFKDGEFDILLSSDVGGEGIDLQFCHAMINYDLPYNPMKIEQRIGRIDRFGQKSEKIVIANLFIIGTVDEEIYERLYRRVLLAEEGVGSFESIIGDEISDLQTAILSGQLTEDEKEELTSRLELHTERARYEVEAYENARNELTSDPLANSSLRRIENDWIIGPDEVYAITKVLFSQFLGSRIEEIGERYYKVVISPELKSEIEKWLRNSSNNTSFLEFSDLLRPLERCTRITFCSEISERDPSLLFLAPAGEWTRFVAICLFEKGLLKESFSIEGSSEDLGIACGRYLVFLYQADIEGLRREIEFHGIPVRISDGVVVEADSPRIAWNLAKGKASQTVVEVSPDVLGLKEVSEIRMQNEIADKIKHLEAQRAFRIGARIVAITESSHREVHMLQQNVNDHIVRRASLGDKSDDQYLRLTQARIRKIEDRLERSISKLNEKKSKAISASYVLEAIVDLTVRDV